MSRDLGAPPTRDRDARDRERPLEAVSRARWDTCLRTCAVVAVIATVAAIATGEAGDNPRGTIAAVGTTGERGRRPGTPTSIVFPGCCARVKFKVKNNLLPRTRLDIVPK